MMQHITPKIEHIYYSHPSTLFSFAVTCIVTLISLCATTSLLGSGDMLGIIFVLSCEAALIATLFNYVSEVETTNKGLEIHYFLRPSRLILWESIYQVTIRQGQGVWLEIRAKSGLLPLVMFPVYHGVFNPNTQVERLLGIIASAANLSVTGHTIWGYPIYKRVPEPDRGV